MDERLLQKWLRLQSKINNGLVEKIVELEDRLSSMENRNDNLNPYIKRALHRQAYLEARKNKA